MESSKPNRVFLVTHGSMNPVHLGHVQMMVSACDVLHSVGYQAPPANMHTRMDCVPSQEATTTLGPAKADTRGVPLLTEHRSQVVGGEIAITRQSHIASKGTVPMPDGAARIPVS